MAYFDEYSKLFVQRTPRYGVKTNAGWRLWRGRLSPKVVKQHLNQERTIGTLARWYPEYAVIDIDDAPMEKVERVRHDLGLNDSNSMLMASESKDSYHLIFRPRYDGRPMTIDRLQGVLKAFIKRNHIELYPQRKRVIRLPFGKYQDCLEVEYLNWIGGQGTWEDKFHWFQHLGDSELTGIRLQQREIPFPEERTESGIILPTFGPGGGGVSQEGAELYQHGLQRPSSRHHGQFAVIYFLWRQNRTPEETKSMVWTWIQEKHNGFSKDIRKYPSSVKAEINGQVDWTFKAYGKRKTYPDSTHNLHKGYITEPDIREIVSISEGSLPRMKYLFHIVKFAYPRRFRQQLYIHSDKLIKWASTETYKKYLSEFENKGILTRSNSYLATPAAKKMNRKAESKAITLNWVYGDAGTVKYEGRAIETFADSIRFLYAPLAFRAMLRATGASRQRTDYIVKTIYG